MWDLYGITRGEWTPIDIDVRGPQSRTLTDSAITADATGDLLGLTGDRLVDSDGDGALDSLQVDVAVDVDQPGSYHLAVDFTDPTRNVEFSGPGTAVLKSGPGVVPVLVPLASLVGASHDGPLQVRDALLTRGTDQRTRVAEAALLGTINAYPHASLDPDRLLLSLPRLTATDQNQDGYLDQIRLTTRAGLPKAGTYRLSGSLLGPDGSTSQLQSTDLDLPAGVSPLEIAFDGAAVRDAGPGQYTVQDLTLVAADDTQDRAAAPPAALTVQDVSGWVGAIANPSTLIQRWKQAATAGEIPSRGLYVSELERLERIKQAHADGDRTKALAELDRFITHLEEKRSAGIDAAAAERIAAYARQVKETITTGNGG